MFSVHVVADNLHILDFSVLLYTVYILQTFINLLCLNNYINPFISFVTLWNIFQYTRWNPNLAGHPLVGITIPNTQCVLVFEKSSFGCPNLLVEDDSLHRRKVSKYSVRSCFKKINMKCYSSLQLIGLVASQIWCVV